MLSREKTGSQEKKEDIQEKKENTQKIMNKIKETK